MVAELKTLEWGIPNPSYLIWVSNGYTFDFILKPSFVDKVEKNQKPVFKLEIPSRLLYKYYMARKISNLQAS